MDGKKLSEKAKAGAVTPSRGGLAGLEGSGCSRKGWDGSITCRIGGAKWSPCPRACVLQFCSFLFPCCQQTFGRPIGKTGVTSLSARNAILSCGCRSPMEKKKYKYEVKGCVVKAVWRGRN